MATPWPYRKELDRDRAVDESGNQLAVFGRRGSRPFNLDEMKRLFMKNNEVFVVPEIKSDDDIRKSFGAARCASTDGAGAAVNTKNLFRFAPVVYRSPLRCFGGERRSGVE